MKKYLMIKSALQILLIMVCSTTWVRGMEEDDAARAAKIARAEAARLEISKAQKPETKEAPLEERTKIREAAAPLPGEVKGLTIPKAEIRTGVLEAAKGFEAVAKRAQEEAEKKAREAAEKEVSAKEVSAAELLKGTAEALERGAELIGRPRPEDEGGERKPAAKFTEEAWTPKTPPSLKETALTPATSLPQIRGMLFELQITPEEVEKGHASVFALSKEPESFLKKHRAGIAIGAGLGAGILGLAGLIGILVSVLGEKKGKEGEAAPLSVIPAPDEGMVPPSVYPPAEEDNREYKKEMLTVAEFFSDIDIKFKESLESTSYFDREFKVESSITIGQTVEKVGIIYNFEGTGAGELGTPFTPFLVTLLPQDISGYELDTSKILAQIQAGPARELLSMLLKPKASFIFMIKIILLINTAMRDSTKNDAEKIDFILSEVNKLYSRLILTPGQILTPATLFSGMPETVTTLSSKKLIKMYSELLFSFKDPVRSPFIKKISQMRQLKIYKQKTSFVTTNIIPLIEKNLTYSEKTLLLHVLKTHLSELPKDKNLDQNIKDLNSVLGKVVSKMKQEGMEQSTIDGVSKLLTRLKTIETNPVKTPELEVSKTIFKTAIPLPDAMDVAFSHFLKIQTSSFNGDPDYLFFDFMLGKNATRYKLQAILFRCMAEILKAEQILSKTNKTVKLRQMNGSIKSINPEQEFNAICKKASQDFIKTQTKLSEAAKQLRDDPKNTLLQKAYDQAAAELNKVSQSLYSNQIKFRTAFAVYYPLEQADGSTRTPCEFIKKEIAYLKKYSKYIDELFKNEYAPFSKHFGFKTEDLLGPKKVVKK